MAAPASVVPSTPAVTAPAAGGGFSGAVDTGEKVLKIALIGGALYVAYRAYQFFNESGLSNAIGDIIGAGETVVSGGGRLVDDLLHPGSQQTAQDIQDHIIKPIGELSGGTQSTVSRTIDQLIDDDRKGKPQGTFFQIGWRSCRKCNLLVYNNGANMTGGTTLRCSQGGLHDLSGAKYYALAISSLSATVVDFTVKDEKLLREGRSTASWCNRCSGMMPDELFDRSGYGGVCYDGAPHNRGFSVVKYYPFNVLAGIPSVPPGLQSGWFFCLACGAMARSGGGCPKTGGSHTMGNWEFLMPFSGSAAMATDAAQLAVVPPPPPGSQYETNQTKPITPYTPGVSTMPVPSKSGTFS